MERKIEFWLVAVLTGVNPPSAVYRFKQTYSNWISTHLGIEAGFNLVMLTDCLYNALFFIILEYKEYGRRHGVFSLYK